MTLEDLLDRDLFRDWLGGLKSETIAGHAQDPESCPLATYLRRKTGREILVDMSCCYDRKASLTEEDNSETFAFLPGWAETFVERVDASDLDQIAAWKALRMLDEVGDD